MVHNRRRTDKITCPSCGKPIGWDAGDCDPMQQELPFEEDEDEASGGETGDKAC